MENNFFGRTDTVDLLKERVSGLKEGYRQNIALLGNRHLGKTALLQEFLHNLDDDNVTTIYLELENRDFHYFFSKYVGSLLYNYSKNKNLPLHDDLNFLLESTQEYIPQTVQVIKKIHSHLQNKKLNDAYLGILTLPEVYTNETSQFCVLVLDEFQVLEEFSLSHPFQNLGKKIMTQKKCLYIVASSYENYARKILSEKLSLLFGNFEITALGPFDVRTSQKFIDQSLLQIRIGAQLKSFLIDFSGGHPLYLNLLCQELMNLGALHNQKEVYLPLLSQAVENTIFSRWGVISRHFELIINDLSAGKGNRSTVSILMAMANGKNKIDQMIEFSGIKKGQLTQRLSRLLEIGLVVKNGYFFYINDKLLKYWIKYVCQRRMMDVELSPNKQKNKFKEEFCSAVSEFKINTRKEFSTRIVELLNCFENDSFLLNGRKYKLPVFREIIPYKLSNKKGSYFDVLLASAAGNSWFVVLKKDPLEENEINVILEETKRMGQRPERCIIISLSTLDTNIRLKALQERFWIWNEGEVNTLLTLFDKPFISR